MFRAYRPAAADARLRRTAGGRSRGLLQHAAQTAARIARRRPAGHLAAIFDMAEVTFRNEIYPEYKAHRPPPPEDLVPQFALIRDATRANVDVVELAGYGPTT
ncbi:MAG: hypothetical protein U1F24_08245 [Alphaproteobacteria bacterium]